MNPPTTPPDSTRPQLEPGSFRRRSARGRWLVRLLLAVGFVGGLAVAAMVAAPALVAGEVRAKLGTLAAETGRTFTVDDVDVELSRGLRVTGLRIGAPDGEGTTLTAAEIATDLDLVDLVGGQRRPGHVRVSGLDLHLTVTPEGVRGLEGLLEVVQHRSPTSSDAASASPQGAPLAIEVRDANATIALELGSEGRLAFDRVQLEGFAGTVTRGGGVTQISGRGRLSCGEHSRQVEATIREDGAAAVALRFDAPLEIPLELGGRGVRLRFAGIERTPGRGLTRLTKVGIATAETSLDIEELIVSDRSGGWLATPGDLVGLEAVGLSGTHEGTHFSAASAGLDVGRGTVRLTGLTGGPARGVQQVLLGFEVGDLAQLLADPVGATLGAIRSVAISGADVTLALPDALQVAAEVPAGETADGASVGDALAAWKARFAAELKADRVAMRKAHAKAKRKAKRLGLTGYKARQLNKAVADGPAPPRPDVIPVGRIRQALARAEARLPERWLRRAAELGVTISESVLRTTDPRTGAPLRLEGLAASVSVGSDGALTPRAAARVIRDGEALGRVEVSADIRDGRIRRVRGMVGGPAVIRAASRLTDKLKLNQRSDLAISFDYTPPEDWSRPLELRGSVAFRDLGFDYWRIAEVPVEGLDGVADFALTLRLDMGELTLDLPRIQRGDAVLTGSVELEKRKFGYRYDLQLAMPRQACAPMFAGIPPELIPRLEGLEVEGEMTFQASLKGRTTAPSLLELQVDGDTDACHVITLGKHIDLLPLKDGTFVHHPLDPKNGRLDDIEVGPGSEQWVESDDIPAHMKAGAIVSEDLGFQKHGGINWFLIERALRINLGRGRFVYGGSSITQQLIKNVFLTHRKALARKLEEMIIGWQLERDLTKDEILTLYLNMIEYGPRIWGIKHASQVYFGVPPRRLSPLSSAFIMSIKPTPRAGHGQFARKRLSQFWVERVKYILTMVFRRFGGMSSTYFKNAAPYQPWKRGR